jgi:hypothetical protein
MGIRLPQPKITCSFGRVTRKRTVLLLFSVLLVARGACGQSTIEIQGGINIANFSDPGNLITGAAWKTHFGFLGSVSTEFPVSENLIINPGLRFVQKGTKSQWWSVWTGNVAATITNNYLEVPVYLRYRLIGITPELSLFGGPSVGYLVSSHTEGTMQLFGPVSSNTRADYKKIDLSFDIGFSAQNPVNEHLAIVAAASYSLGLIRISQLGSNERTRDLRVTVGTIFNIE